MKHLLSLRDILGLDRSNFKKVVWNQGFAKLSVITFQFTFGKKDETYCLR